MYYQIGNSVLNARPFAVNGIPEPKAAYAQNRFGFSAGGPLFIPKLFNLSKVFWFVNYQGNLSRNGVDQAYSEPTPLQRLGDFSQTSSIIYDPTTNAPFPNNKIPLTQISPIAQGLLGFLPLPNENVAGVNQNFRLIVANPNNTQSLNTRLNTTIGQKDTLALTFNLQKRNTSTYQYFGCCDTRRRTRNQHQYQLASPLGREKLQQRDAHLQSQHQHHDSVLCDRSERRRRARDSRDLAQLGRLRSADAQLHQLFQSERHQRNP